MKYNLVVIYYCKECDRTDTSSLPTMKCANCQKDMVDIGWQQGRMRLEDD